jgi:hypothetical protein
MGCVTFRSPCTKLHKHEGVSFSAHMRQISIFACADDNTRGETLIGNKKTRQVY